jgi:uncharacterized protein (DUF2461 family)
VLKSGVELEGETLKRPPAGFDKTHPFIEDLKRKDLYGLTAFTQAEVISSRFINRYMQACVEVTPLVEFLTTAVGVS